MKRPEIYVYFFPMLSKDLFYFYVMCATLNSNKYTGDRD